MKKITVILGIFLFLSCQKQNQEQAKGANANDNSDTKKEANYISEEGPLGKFSEPITLTSWYVSSGYLPDGESWDDNRWTRAISKDLNINFKWLWHISTPSPTDMNTKINTAIVSGDLADIMRIVGTDVVPSLAKRGLLEDLTDVYNKFASPDLKKYLNRDDYWFSNKLSYKNKLYAIAYNDTIHSRYDIGYVRQDWLSKLGLQVPKTSNDILKLIKAFSEDDPDGDGKVNTNGIALCNDLYTNSIAIRSFFSMYGSYLKSYVQKDGKLVRSDLEPETKKVLSILADFYKKGYLADEFFTIPGCGITAQKI